MDSLSLVVPQLKSSLSTGEANSSSEV
jgi:hypothetical protein